LFVLVTWWLLFVDQFMQEMAVAWKMTVDMRLGLFAVSHDESCSVPGSHALDYQPSVINITPHHLWTRVSITAGALLAIKPEACAMVIIARWSLENNVNVCWAQVFHTKIRYSAVQ